MGSLVAKTLSAASAAGFYGQRTAPPPAAFDVFSVQVWMGAGCGALAGPWLGSGCGKGCARASGRVEPLAAVGCCWLAPARVDQANAGLESGGLSCAPAPQACTNTIMAHFVGMLFSNWLLTVVNKFKCAAGSGWQGGPARGYSR